MDRKMAPLKYERFWIACGIGFVILVIYLSLVPEPPDFGVQEAFNAGHVIAYAWLMFWFAQIFRTASRRLLLGAAFCAMGVLLEYLQQMGGVRHFEYADMALNTGGVGIGLILGATPLQNTLRALEKALGGNPAPLRSAGGPRTGSSSGECGRQGRDPVGHRGGKGEDQHAARHALRHFHCVQLAPEEPGRRQESDGREDQGGHAVSAGVVLNISVRVPAADRQPGDCRISSSTGRI
jgi:hypothetical protein